MGFKSWIDGILLGPEATTRAKDAEDRLCRAGMVRARLDEAELLELDKLTCLTRDLRQSATRIADTPSRPVRIVSMPEIEVTRAS